MPSRVPLGSTITQIYFAVVPYIGATYFVGVQYDTLDDALDAAADNFVDGKIAFKEAGVSGLPPFPSIEERWVIKYPPDATLPGSIDMPVERMETDLVMLHLSRDRRGLPD